MRKSSMAFALALGALAAVGCDDAEVADEIDAGTDGGRDAALGTPGLDASVDASADSAAGQSVTIRFKAKLGSQDLVCGQTYANLGSSKLSGKVQDFRLFIEQVRLIDAAGREVPVVLDERLPHQTKDVALLDFTDGVDACTSGAATTNMIITGRVPTGTYKGIVLVNGVPEALNHGDPSTAPAPLRAPGASWNWLSGYRFTMAELLPVAAHGALDAGSDAGAHGSGSDAGAGDAGAAHGGGGGAVFVHTGSTACSGSPTSAAGVTCTKPNRAEIRFASFDLATQSIVADLAAVFADVDLGQGTQCHGTGESCRSMYSALGIDLDQGSATPATQKVYRVE